MKKTRHFLFIFFVAILIVSEYLFLREFFSRENTGILLLTAAGVVVGIIGTITIIRKFY